MSNPTIPANNPLADENNVYLFFTMLFRFLTGNYRENWQNLKNNRIALELRHNAAWSDFVGPHSKSEICAAKGIQSQIDWATAEECKARDNLLYRQNIYQRMLKNIARLDNIPLHADNRVFHNMKIDKDEKREIQKLWSEVILNFV